MTHTLVGVGLSLSSWADLAAVRDVSRPDWYSITSGLGSATSVSSSSAVGPGKTTGCSSDPPTMGCPPLSASKIIMTANELATAFKAAMAMGSMEEGREQNNSMTATTSPRACIGIPTAERKLQRVATDG